MGPFEMVVAIVGIGAVASVIKAKYGHGYGPAGFRNRRWQRSSLGIRRDGNQIVDWQQAGWEHGENHDLAQENRQLRDELHGLKERIQVLERLATDDESDARRLDREIEKLRERPGLTANKTTGE